MINIPTNNGKIGAGSGDSPMLRPQDPYSPLWGAYWAENPMLKRGLGADGVDPEPEPEAEPEEDLDQIRRDAADTKRLREENERLTAKSREADKHKKEQEKAARDAAAAAARASGDLESYAKSVDEKIAGITQEIGSERDLYRAIAERRTSGAAASDLANRLAVEIDGVNTMQAILPHISGRIGSKVVDGDLVPVVLDASGRETALTLDDLEKELRKIPHLKPFISGSRANGNGNPGGNGGGNGKLRTRAQVESMNPFDQSSYFKENGGKYAD